MKNEQYKLFMQKFLDFVSNNNYEWENLSIENTDSKNIRGYLTTKSSKFLLAFYYNNNVCEISIREHIRGFSDCCYTDSLLYKYPGYNNQIIKYYINSNDYFSADDFYSDFVNNINFDVRIKNEMVIEIMGKIFYEQLKLLGYNLIDQNIFLHSSKNHKDIVFVAQKNNTYVIINNKKNVCFLSDHGLSCVSWNYFCEKNLSPLAGQWHGIFPENSPQRDDVEKMDIICGVSMTNIEMMIKEYINTICGVSCDFVKCRKQISIEPEIFCEIKYKYNKNDYQQHMILPVGTDVHAGLKKILSLFRINSVSIGDVFKPEYEFWINIPKQMPYLCNLLDKYTQFHFDGKIDSCGDKFSFVRWQGTYSGKHEIKPDKIALHIDSQTGFLILPKYSHSQSLKISENYTISSYGSNINFDTVLYEFIKSKQFPRTIDLINKWSQFNG